MSNLHINLFVLWDKLKTESEKLLKEVKYSRSQS